MKKFLSALLCMLLIFSLSVTAFATTYVKASSSTNIRKGAGLGYAKVSSISAGTKLTYLGSYKRDSRGVKWYKVKYNGYTRYVSSKYTYLTSSSSYKYVTADDGSAYIRKSASKYSTKLGALPQGKTATYLGSTKTDSRGIAWYKVKYNGVTGWVSSRNTHLG